MKTRQVWILDEGSQGHLVQSRGLLRELGKVASLDVSEVRLSRLLPRRFSRSLVKRLLRLHPYPWLFRLLHPKTALPENTPELMVASGPHSLAALEYLSKHYACPSVFVQGTIPVREGAVTAIMRPFEGSHRDDFIFIPLLFTEITPQVIEQAKESYLSANAIRPRGIVNALFIGNSSAKIQFSAEDWLGVARFVNDLWKSDGSQWLITTSSRTGRELETLFKREIHPDAILDAVWYSEAPRKVTRDFLGLADRVFVTMDSLTMLTEAVASGRPTCALCPLEPGEETANTHVRYVHDLAANGFITRTRAGHDTVPPPMPPPSPEVDYSAPIRELMTRIHWNS